MLLSMHYLRDYLAKSSSCLTPGEKLTTFDLAII